MPSRKANDFITAALAARTDACILWPFALHRGYGRMECARKRVRVHRYVCELAYGPPSRLRREAAHLCGVKRCVNPAHLRWSSREENIADRFIQADGTESPWAAKFWPRDKAFAEYRLTQYPKYLKPR